MREVDDSPNRCPRCQRVQMQPVLCLACEQFFQTDTDLVDILDILLKINQGAHMGEVAKMITSMRTAIKRRNPYVSSR